MGKKKKKGGRKQNGDLISPAEVKLQPEAECAWKIIQSHASVCGIVGSPQSMANGGFEIKFNMGVSLPSRANRKRISETGVKLQEPVILHFLPLILFMPPNPFKI